MKPSAERNVGGRERKLGDATVPHILALLLPSFFPGQASFSELGKSEITCIVFQLNMCIVL
jgi:hypothetical protein